MTYRHALDDSTALALNARIIERLLVLPEIERAKWVHCYWPLIGKREIDTVPLIQALLASGKEVVLPVVTTSGSSDNITPGMTHRQYEPETNLIANRWGVMEPVHGPEVSPHLLEVVIVPALGVDTRGNRVGYGKGFYDAFLAQCDCPFICPIYSHCIANAIPIQDHDVSVDIIVTEHEVIRVLASDM